MKGSTGRIILGLAVVFLGILFLLEQVGLSDYIGGRSLIGFFWPALILGAGVLFLVKGGITPGIIFLTLGALFFASNLFGWQIWGNWWPAILIAVGVAILLGKTTEKTFVNTISGEYNKNRLDDFLVLWGGEKRITSTEFEGGKITCMFGGEKIDLRDATIAKAGGKLDIFCAFGGVEIIVPTHINIEITGNAFLGGVDNKTAPTTRPGSPKLVINCTTTFGGVEIKN